MTQCECRESFRRVRVYPRTSGRGWCEATQRPIERQVQCSHRFHNLKNRVRVRGLKQEREDSDYEKESDDTQRIAPEQRSGGFGGRRPPRARRTKWLQLEEGIIDS